jgi:predicted transcriptional regulator
MPKENADLPEELLQRVDEEARRFNRSRVEIVGRAVAHYLEHVTEVQVAYEGSRESGNRDADWSAIKETLQEARCPYDDCPFADGCPVELCPL